jgi:hypothetical protein
VSRRAPLLGVCEQVHKAPTGGGRHLNEEPTMNATFRLLPIGLALAAALSLQACGGGDDDTASAGGLVAACDTKSYVAGAVLVPTADELKAYAGTFNGDEGSYDGSGNFVKSGSAKLVIGTDGAVTYKDVKQTVTSICLDKTAGTFGKIMYFITGKGHLDVADKVAVGLGQAWGVSPADGTTIFTNGVK